MKIAICLSGINNICNEFLEHFISSIMHLDADLHIHSWSNVGKNQDIQEVLPNIKSLVLEEQNKKFGWHYATTDQWVNPLNTALQLYGISKSFDQALNSNIKYDLYVRCRFDVFVGNKINYRNLNSEYMHMLPNGRAHPPRSSQVFHEKINIYPLPKDFFWVCGKKDAEISARLFDNAEHNNVYENIVMVGEDLIFHHFAKNEVKIKLLEDNQVNGLYRHANHPHGDGLIIYNAFGFKKHNE